MAFFLLGGGTHPAYGLTITGESCTPQATNSLRFDCTITTDVASNVWVKFGPVNAATCSGSLTRATPTSINGTSHTVTMFGMKPTKWYGWQAQAIPTGGGALVPGTRSCSTTTALPTGGAAEANIDRIDVASVVAGPRDMRNVVTHYGCWDGAGTSARRDDLLVFDQDGEIVWYQDPASDLGFITTPVTHANMEAISISRPEHTLLGIINHEIIVEYDLAGDLVTVLCRDDGSGICPGTVSYVPDAFFADYVHHDVQRLDDTIFALSAKDVDVTDVDDCDGDGSVTDAYPIVVDGLYGFNTSGSVVTQDVDWDWSDAIGVTVDYSVTTCPAPGAGYWVGMLTGQDYMHTNSFWLDVAQQWMFSLRDHDAVWSVDRDPTSSTENYVLWELDGTGAGGDFTFVSGGYDESFDGQHHAHWGPTGELVLFDNDNTAGGAPRGMVYDLDATSMTADATSEYTMADAASAAFSCPIGGSAFVMLGGHMVATCPETGPTSSKHAVINEFSASNTQVWTLELECDAGGSAYGPSSLAFRAFGNAW